MLGPERPQTEDTRLLPCAVAGVPPQIFVGRRAAVARVQQWWTTALQGQRQVGVIAGEHGIGKTALVDTLVAQFAATEDAWIGHGQCLDHYGAGEAYFPALEALGRLGRGADGADVRAVLHQQAPSWLVHLPSLFIPGDRERLELTAGDVTPARMLRKLADALEGLSVIHPLVLILEDLPWSDHATLEWLAYVARRRDPARVIILGTYRPYLAVIGLLLQGWAVAMQGQPVAGLAQICQGLVTYQAIVGGVALPHYHALLAEAYARAGQPAEGLAVLTEVLAVGQRTGERWWEAELYRLRDTLVLRQSTDHAAEAEACIHEALAVARRQKAKSLELRAAMSLSRLWQPQGKRGDARQLITECYRWFTEGFVTADLQEARALLEELS